MGRDRDAVPQLVLLLAPPRSTLPPPFLPLPFPGFNTGIEGSNTDDKGKHIDGPVRSDSSSCVPQGLSNG